MNRLLTMLAIGLLAAASGFAQTDTTQKNAPDTIRVGGFIIVKSNKDGDKQEAKKDSKDFHISFKSRYKNRNNNVSTNWLIFDLGLANWRDKTDYNGPAFTNQSAGSGYIRNVPYQGNPSAGNAVDENTLNLKNGKTTNVNIWLFMQKLNITKHVVNLKYGLGLEMYNYRFESNVSFRNSPEPYLFRDSIQFSKNKLYAGYATVPLMLNINPFPNSHRTFTFSAGVSAGYLIASRNKQVSDERGKQKYRGNLNLTPWRLATIAELGMGPIRLYGTYSFNNLMEKDKTNLELYPYAVGIRFSNW